MYPWIANPAMAKVIAFDFLQADRDASRTSSQRSSHQSSQRARAAQATAEEAPSDASLSSTPRPRRLVRALRLAH